MKPIYMAVDLNYCELPYAVADSAKELALMVGVKEKTVQSAISNVKAGRAKEADM